MSKFVGLGTACSDLGCPVCSVRHGGQKGCLKGNCQANNIGYVATCVTCQEAGKTVVYEGESGRNLKQRSLEHWRDIRSCRPTSGLYCHIRDHHGGSIPVIRFQVRQRFCDALSRQLDEGARIEETDDEQLMNTRDEWVPPVLSRMSVN